MDTRRRRLYREVNERIGEISDRFGGDVASYHCECGDRTCRELVVLTRQDFDALLVAGDAFVVAKGHARASDVAYRARTFDVVRPGHRVPPAAREWAPVLAAAAARLREAIGARLADGAIPDGDEGFVVVAADGDRARDFVSMRLPGDSKTGAVFRRGVPALVPSIRADEEVDQASAARMGTSAGVWAPIMRNGRAVAVVAAFDKVDGPFTEADLQAARRVADAAATDHRVRILA